MTCTDHPFPDMYIDQSIMFKLQRCLVTVVSKLYRINKRGKLTTKNVQYRAKPTTDSFWPKLKKERLGLESRAWSLLMLLVLTLLRNYSSKRTIKKEQNKWKTEVNIKWHSTDLPWIQYKFYKAKVQKSAGTDNKYMNGRICCIFFRTQHRLLRWAEYVINPVISDPIRVSVPNRKALEFRLSYWVPVPTGILFMRK